MERLDEINGPLRRTGRRIAIGSGIDCRGSGNGLNALCHHVAIQHYWIAARRHSMVVVGEVGRLGLYRNSVSSIILPGGGAEAVCLDSAF